MNTLAARKAPVALLVLALLASMAGAAEPEKAVMVADANGVFVADAQIRSMDRLQAEQERLRARIAAQPAAYEDKFMSTDEAGPAVSSDDAAAQAQPEGLRSWSLESRIGWAENNTDNLGRRQATEYGVHGEYRQETLNWGDVLFQFDGRHLSGDRLADMGGIGSLGYARERTSDRFVLRTLGTPITSSVFADNTLGDMYSEITDGLSRNYRLSLSTTTVRGLSTRVFGEGFDIRAGTGARGDWAGGPYPGYEKTQGNLSWLGATKRLSDEWFVSGQANYAADVPAYYFGFVDPIGFGSKDVTSFAASVGYSPKALAEQAFRLRTTVLTSSVGSGTPGVPTGSAQGVFVEGSTRLGRYAHQFGAYTADPYLHFGDSALINGTHGAYWRVDRSSSRLSWGGGLDYERGDSDLVFNPYGYRRTGGSANVQYVLDRESSVGANVNVYQTSYDAMAGAAMPADNRSVYGNAYYQTRFFDLPRSRLSLTTMRNEQIVLFGDTATGQLLEWEQDWIFGRYESQRPELTTTLGYARDQSSGVTRTYPTAGLMARYWFDSSFYVAANLRYTSQDSDLYTSRGLSGSVTAEKELTPGWRAGVALNMNQARSTSLQVLPSYAPSVYRSDDKTIYVYLRYDGSTGTPFGTMGARSGAGSGIVEGRVFFDANRDGRQQSGENGVANVEVVLDGRYRTVTDRDGRYQFPMVTTGGHRLTLTPESVPLPWGTPEDASVSVNVPLRGRANADIPVIKVGD